MIAPPISSLPIPSKLTSLFYAPGREYPAMAAGSVVVLKLRPSFFEWHLRVAADVDGKVVLVRHAVLAPHHVGLFDVAEHVFKGFERDADADHDLSVATSWSPKIIVVVAADGIGKTIFGAVEVHRRGLAVIAGQDAGFALLLRRQPVAYAGHGTHHVLPAQPVGEVQRELVDLSTSARPLYPEVHAGEGAVNLRHRFHGYRRHGGEHRNNSAGNGQKDRVGGFRPSPSTLLEETLQR